MRNRKTVSKLNKNSTLGAVFIIAFVVFMAFVTWFLLPEFKSVFDGEVNILDKKLIYAPEPTSTPISTPTPIVQENQVDETAETDIAQPALTIVPKEEPIDGYIADENSYKSDHVEVKIEKVNEDYVTYYVADVKIKDMSDITSATYNKLGSDITLKPATAIAQKYNAIISINTDFYTYKNRGLIIRNGIELLNKGYRDFLCLFDTGRMEVYKQGDFTAKELIAQGVQETFEFGPVLIKDGRIDEAVYSKVAQSKTRHPRCGVGYYNEGHYLFIVVDGRKEGYSIGVTIQEFAEIFENYGVELAYNLDGGGSATMTFMGELVNKPEGNNIQRKIDNILYVKDTEYVSSK